MSGYYPAGMTRLPGEEPYECPRCGETIDPLAWPFLSECPCEETTNEETEAENA